MASISASNVVAFKAAGVSDRFGQLRQYSPVHGANPSQLRPLLGLHCRLNASLRSSGKDMSFLHFCPLLWLLNWFGFAYDEAESFHVGVQTPNTGNLYGNHLCLTFQPRMWKRLLLL